MFPSRPPSSHRLLPPRLALGLLGAGLTALAAVALAQTRGALPAEAIELRNIGLAELENERPAEAEPIFRRLTQLHQTDPLGPANLAIALLRQQKAGEALLMVQRALQVAPERGDLLAIRGDILAWQGDAEAALAAYRQAAASAPDDPVVQYALYRHASSAMRGDAADAAAGEALERLRGLRPENLVVLLERANRGIAAGDRAAASDALLRVRELLFSAPPVAAQLLGEAFDALEAGDTAKARAPSLRLSNLLKSTPMFRGSLVELAIGIQGNPITRFVAEPPSASFGEPVPVRFAASVLDPAPTRALVAADLDGDELPDTARLVGEGEARTLEIRLTTVSSAPVRLPAPGVESLLLVDLDNDGTLDLLGYGGGTLRVWRGSSGGSFTDATAAFGLGDVAALAVAPIDFDSEGDLDLFVAAATSPTARIYRNSLEGPLQDLGSAPLPSLERVPATGALAADLDRDGDPDLVLWGESGVVWLENLRQGRFHDRTVEAGLGGLGAVTAVVAADLDNDGRPELVLGGPRGLRVLRSRDGRYQPAPSQPGWQPQPLAGGEAARADRGNEQEQLLRCRRHGRGQSRRGLPVPRGRRRRRPLRARRARRRRPPAGGVDQRRPAEPAPPPARPALRRGAGAQGQLPLPLRRDR
jgi:Tfp pilus assembly protein PilF